MHQTYANVKDGFLTISLSPVGKKEGRPKSLVNPMLKAEVSAIEDLSNIFNQPWSTTQEKNICS